MALDDLRDLVLIVAGLCYIGVGIFDTVRFICWWFRKRRYALEDEPRKRKKAV